MNLKVNNQNFKTSKFCEKLKKNPVYLTKMNNYLIYIYITDLKYFKIYTYVLNNQYI